MNLSPSTWDAIIVGAGAAGLMAAASAASRGRKVLLLEKNRKLGVKILMSGGTRCNITHACSARQIANAFGRQGKFLLSALASLPPDEVIRKLESQGVETKIESTGKIFPVSNKAIDVRDALVRLAADAGATIKNEHSVLNIVRMDESETNTGSPTSFRVETEQEKFTCRHLLVTTGGKSYPGCGTVGEGYSWVKSFGHTIEHPVPALTPITCNLVWANELKGITLDDVEIELWESAKLVGRIGNRNKSKPLDKQRGSFLFTHFGFSGPPVLNISRFITRRDSPAGLTLQCDFAPTLTSTELINALKNKSGEHGRLSVVNWLTRILPKRLAECLAENAGVDSQQKTAELSNAQIQKLAKAIKQMHLPVSGTLGFKKAEVTAGGVDLTEIDSRTMESKRVPGLFLAGEILDLDGPIGGFNFQAAFSTGWLAGQNL